MTRYLLILSLLLSVSLSEAQVRIGPVINLGMARFQDLDPNIREISPAFNPSFGIALEKYIDYWFSIRSSALYSFKSFKANQQISGSADILKGQFIDVFVEGVFGDFDGFAKISPYGITGLGLGSNIVNTGQEDFLTGTNFEPFLPFYTIGLGARYKPRLLSMLDVSLNYNRCLIQPVKDIDTKLNQFNLKLITFF